MNRDVIKQSYFVKDLNADFIETVTALVDFVKTKQRIKH